VDLAGLCLQNPVMTCSGTSGYGVEYADLLDLHRLGAFVTKSITPEARKGNPPERIVETSAGMLNAIGLANVGLVRFISEKLPFLRELGIPVIVNVAGHTIADYLTVCRALDPIDGIDAIELNISCPNVADGLEFGTDADRLRTLVAAVRKEVGRSRVGNAHRTKLIVKLSPNVTDIAVTARAAIEGGADILSLINTLQGLAINVDKCQPMLANLSGGLSGPAIKPIALFMVHRVYTEVAAQAGVPIIGMGGITDWRDAVEFFLAGASAVGIGTALFINPAVATQVIEGVAQYLRRQRLTSIRQIIGKLHR